MARRLPSELVYARKRAFSVPIRHFIQNEGMFRLQHDVDVFDAFRIRKDRLEQVLRPSKDSQKLWRLLESKIGNFSGHGQISICESH